MKPETMPVEPSRAASRATPLEVVRPVEPARTEPAARTKRAWRRWVAAALVAVVLVGGLVGYRAYRSGLAGPRYQMAHLERGPITATVSATGNLNAVVMVLVGSQVSGTIKTLHADFNTTVRVGQVIAQIDPALFEAAVNQGQAEVDAARSTIANLEAQVEQARANVANARAALLEGQAQTAKARVAVTDAQRTLGRQAALFERALVAAADRDAAQTASDSAVAQQQSAEAHEQVLASAVAMAEAQLHSQEAARRTARDQAKVKEATLAQARINLDHTTIRSPVDGIVVNRAVDVGQTVAATLQAPTLFTIAQDLTKMQVETSVDEADIGRIDETTPVTFTVDAFPGETFAGRVSQIRKAPQVVQNVVTYTVVVAVDNPAGTLLPGMTANVRFVTAQKADVLKVPNTALRFRPPDDGDRREGQPERAPTDRRPGAVGATAGRVWVLGPNRRPTPVLVTLGVSDGTSTEVVGGALSPGHEVLVGVEAEPTPPTAPSPPRLRF